jgi:uncharacterized membrane protein
METTSRKPGLLDTHSRSFAKAISWRTTGTLDTIVVSFVITGHIKLTLSIGGVELFTKLFLYYLHERVWNRIPFGKAKESEDYEI